jgi:hypothetical protein
MVECVCSMCIALGSISSMTKEKKIHIPGLLLPKDWC